MRTLGLSAGLITGLLAASTGVQAAPPAAAQLEPILLKALACNAQNSIWLQGASFKIDKLSIEASAPGFSFSAELLTTMAGGVKQEKGQIKGTGTPEGRVTVIQTVDDVDEVRPLRAECLG